MILTFLKTYKKKTTLNNNTSFKHKISNPFMKLIKNHIIYYPKLININYAWNFGSLAGIFFALQIITGVFLALHYTPNIDLAFWSLEHIMRDVNNGWLLRYMHANRASMIFICLYIHIAKAMYYRSYTPGHSRAGLFFSGIIIFLLIMGTAFIGYVLLFGQMSLWGATIITNLITVLLFIGENIAFWIRSGFSVNNPILNRFFNFYYILPFIIISIIFLHLIMLHLKRFMNLIGLTSIHDRIDLTLFISTLCFFASNNLKKYTSIFFFITILIGIFLSMPYPIDLFLYNIISLSSELIFYADDNKNTFLIPIFFNKKGYDLKKKIIILNKINKFYNTKFENFIELKKPQCEVFWSIHHFKKIKRVLFFNAVFNYFIYKNISISISISIPLFIVDISTSFRYVFFLWYCFTCIAANYNFIKFTLIFAKNIKKELEIFIIDSGDITPHLIPAIVAGTTFLKTATFNSGTICKTALSSICLGFWVVDEIAAALNVQPPTRSTFQALGRVMDPYIPDRIKVDPTLYAKDHYDNPINKKSIVTLIEKPKMQLFNPEISNKAYFGETYEQIKKRLK